MSDATETVDYVWGMIFPIYLQNLQDTLREQRVDFAPYLQHFGLSLPDGRLPEGLKAHRTYLQIVEAVQADHDIPGLGLRTGERLHLSDHGLLGYAINSCENLDRAIDIFCDYSPILGGYRANKDVDGDQASLNFVNEFRLDFGPASQLQVEETFAIWLNLSIKWPDPGPWFNEVHVEFDRPEEGSLHEEFFACPVLFGQPHNRILFDRDYLYRHFLGYNEQLFNLSLAQCAVVLSDMPKMGGLTQEIRDVLARCTGRFPTYQEICEHFHVSAATLRRRLAAEDTNYQQLLKSFRVELACRYLRETTLSVNEIAYLTGYQDPANFNRAFRSVMGLSPARYRDGAG